VVRVSISYCRRRRCWACGDDGAVVVVKLVVVDVDDVIVCLFDALWRISHMTCYNFQTSKFNFAFGHQHPTQANDDIASQALKASGLRPQAPT